MSYYYPSASEGLASRLAGWLFWESKSQVDPLLVSKLGQKKKNVGPKPFCFAEPNRHVLTFRMCGGVYILSTVGDAFKDSELIIPVVRS